MRSMTRMIRFEIGCQALFQLSCILITKDLQSYLLKKRLLEQVFSFTFSPKLCTVWDLDEKRCEWERHTFENTQWRKVLCGI